MTFTVLQRHYRNGKLVWVTVGSFEVYRECDRVSGLNRFLWLQGIPVTNQNYKRMRWLYRAVPVAVEAAGK
jgi:hypothetical protein